MQRPRTYGLIAAFLLAACHLQVAQAQFGFPPNAGIKRVPRLGSVSRASSNAYEREVDYGPVEVTHGVTNSRAVTKQNGGARNGGTTSVARSNALSREVNLGGLPIGSTLTRSQTRTNGAVSRGVAHDLNIGNLGIGTSLSRDNLRNGFGLQRGPDGGVSLGLGLLNVGLTNNAQQQNSQALTQAQVNAQGKNARAKSNSNSLTNTQQYGGVGVTETRSRSNAVGRSRFGSTSANANGLTSGLGSNAGSFGAPRGFLRRRRATPARANAAPASSQGLSRPRRRAQFVPFIYPEPDFEVFRVRRQFGGQRRRPGAVYFPQEENANAQGIANNKGNRFEQQAGANSHSNNKVTGEGAFQDNGASSIGSNLANDGSSGQVSSANVAQMNSETAGGFSNSNDAQSQALNFDPNQQQASSANAGTKHMQTQDSEHIDANSGSQVTNNNAQGTSTNIANTNSGVFREGNTEGAKSDASSQSLFQGANGQNSAALTNSKTESVRGPGGFVSNSATSNASATSQGGKGANANANASASSNSGGGGNNAFTNSQAGAGGFGGFGGFQGGANANSGANSGFSNHRRVQRQARPQRQNGTLQLPQRLWQPPRKLQLPNGVEEQHLATEVTDLRRSSSTTAVEQPWNGNQRYPPTMLMRPRPSDVVASNATEQFGPIDESERQGRTFSFITDFFNNLGCTSPCTLEAFRQNRCCLEIPAPPPAQVCCRPYPLPRPPLLPQRPPIVVPPSQVNCCVTCSYGYYGPPPCMAFGGGYGNFGSGGLGNFGTGNTGANFGGGFGNFGTGNAGATFGGGLFGNTGQVSLSFPPLFG